MARRANSRLTLDSLRITLHSTRKVALLEQLVPLRTSRLGLGRVDVRLAIIVRLGLFSLAELGKYIRCPVFGEGFRVELDGVGEVVLFLVRGTDPCISPTLSAVSRTSW